MNMKRFLNLMASLAVISLIAFGCEKSESEDNSNNNGTEQDNGDGNETQTALKADFSYEKEGLTVKFTNTSTGATACIWDFGDSTDSQEESPEHTYAAAGTYTVKLTVANDAGEIAEKEASVTVAGAVKANFSFTAQTDRAGKFGKIINFDATGSLNPVSIVWDFGDGTVTSVSTDFTISHEFAEFKTYTVKATVTGEAGDTDTFESQVEVVAYTELIKGGSMEADDAQYWTYASGDTTEGYVTVEGKPSFVSNFGFNQAGPEGMVGGCLKVSGDNQVEDGSYNFQFYQPVKLLAGDVIEISANVRWDENTIDNGVLFLCVSPDVASFGTDDTAVLQIANWWSVVEATETTPKSSSPLPAYSGDLSGKGVLTSDNSGFDGDGNPTVTYTCPADGTYYIGIHATAIWGLVYGASSAYYFDNFSANIKL